MEKVNFSLILYNQFMYIVAHQGDKVFNVYMCVYVFVWGGEIMSIYVEHRQTSAANTYALKTEFHHLSDFTSLDISP